MRRSPRLNAELILHHNMDEVPCLPVLNVLLTSSQIVLKQRYNNDRKQRSLSQPDNPLLDGNKW